jgi:PhnB protein
MSTPAARDGYRTVTPRMVVRDPAATVEFLRTVFGATGPHAERGPAEVRIGDSLVLISATGERAAFPAFLYVYVTDADATYHQALAAGATTVEEPRDTPYGDRRAMVQDPAGNIYQLAQYREAP